MFFIIRTSNRTIMKGISYKYHSMCSCEKLIFSKFEKPISQQTRMISSEMSSSNVNFIQYYNDVFKSLSESTPVQLLQKSLIDVHDYSGIPWWATIICSTILLRTTITLPLAIYQQIILAKLELLRYEMNELVKELKKEATIAAKMYNWNEETTRRIYNYSLKSNWKKLIIRDNCHPFKTSLLLWVQIPLWISVSMTLRNMIYMQPVKDNSAELTFNQLTVEGLLWIQNLTEIDSTYVLPVTFGLLNLCLIELATMSKVTVPTKLQRIITNIFRSMAILMIPISASVPSGLVLYWTTSSMFGLVQNMVLMSPKIKRIVGIPLAPSELENPYKQLAIALKKRIMREDKKI